MTVMAMVNPTSEARNPFDILPANLFNLFSTQGRGGLSRHYVAILLRLYVLAEFNRFGLTRELVIAEIVDYLASDGVAEAVAAAVDEENEPAELAGRSGLQDYAGYLLRRLEDTGWIE